MNIISYHNVLCKYMDDDELELLLALAGSDFEMAPGVVVEFTARRTEMTPERPHGISYAFVLREKDGGPSWVRFDNAHAVDKGRRHRKRAAHNHWHRTEKHKRPSLELYDSRSATRRLLERGKEDAR